MNRSTRLFRYSLLALAAGTLAACSEDGGFINIPPQPAPPAPVADTFVITSGNKLIGFAASTPGTALTNATLAIPAGETLLGGDFRPADGLFYIVTRVTADNAVKVYTADTATGALGTAIPLLNTGTGAGGGVAGSPVTLAGPKVGVDFNPVANALRIIDSTGVNLRTNLSTTANNTFVDAPISAGLTEAAYTNSFSDTCQTDLFYINGTQLLLTGAPNGIAGNAATPRLVGSLGITADTANSGFDVRTTASGNVLTAAISVNGAYSLYEISAASGAATRRGAIGIIPMGEVVLGLATSVPDAGDVTNAPGDMLAITGGATPSVVTFNRPPQGSAARLCTTSAVTGLATGDAIVGADTRPNGGLLYALAKNNTVGTLYTIARNGTATSVATLAADPADTTAPYSGLDGTSFAVDFNPVPDRLRVISDTGQNLRMTVAAVAGTTPIAAGAVTTDTALTTAAGGAARTGVTAAGYTNSLFGGNGASLTTTLYAIDSTANSLVQIGANPGNGIAGDAGNPNSGVVNEVGALGVDVGDVNAFDITASTGTALLAATVGANTTLYTVNLASGAATAAGNFPATAGPIVAMGSNGSQTATVFGVTPSNQLVSFLPSAPATVTTIGTITVGSGENIQGIDFRPSIGAKNGTLVALTTTAGGAARLYTVDTASAAATPVASLSANSTDATAPFTTTTGTAFGVDFNPLPDALRTVSTTQENLRSNPDSGATFTDGNLNVTGVHGAGYTNSFTTTATTQLFYLRDAGGGNSELYGTTAPNDGTLTLVGTNLGADYSALGDLDFAGGQNGFALAALQPATGGVSGLFRINTTTGVATSVGNIATTGNEPLVGIAIQVK